MALTQSAIEELTALIDTVGREWVQEYIRIRAATLRKRKVDTSGKLIESMQYALTKTANSAITNTIELAFEDYGRYIEMKRLNVAEGGQEFIDSLAAWIIKKGFVQKWQPAFLEKRKLKTAPQNIANQMAWGIVKNRNKGYRRRAWYAKSKSAAVSDLFNRVAAEIPELILNELKAAFQTAV